MKRKWRNKGSDLEYLILFMPLVCVSVWTLHFKESTAEFSELGAGKRDMPGKIHATYREELSGAALEWTGAPKFLPQMGCTCISLHV